MKMGVSGTNIGFEHSETDLGGIRGGGGVALELDIEKMHVCCP